MGRAERRRMEKINRKANKNKKTNSMGGVSNLPAPVRMPIDDIKLSIRNEAVNAALILTFALPMKVLIDHYWQKSYKKRLPGFTDKMLDYYKKWESGELDLTELEKELWDNCGIRFESDKR